MLRSVLLLTFIILSPQLFSQDIDSLKQVLSSSAEIKAKTSAYRSLLNHFRRKDTVSFKEYMAEAIQYARETGQKQAELEFAFTNCKRLYSSGRYRKLIAETDSLYLIARAGGYKDLQATMLNYSGNAYSNLSDYPNAAVQFIEYLSVAMQMEDNAQPVAMANNNIGMAFMNMERFDQAIDYLNRSLEGQEEFDSGFKAHTFWNLGVCYMELDRFEEALQILRSGVKEAERKGDGYAAAGNQVCIGSVYIRQDLFEPGIKAYTQAYEMSLQSELEPYKVIEALNGLIYSYNQLGRPQEALQYIGIADSITERHKLSDLRNREFLFYKGSNLLLRGKPQQADEVFKRYSSAVDSLQNVENLEIIQAKETEFRTKQKEQQLELKEAELGFQRQLNIILGIGAVLLLLIGILVYRQQRLKIRNQKQEQALKDALLTVETNKKLEDQRQRIAKELHDNIGSQLTYLASAAQNIGTGMKKTTADITENKLKDLAEFSQDAITDLRDTIWVMNRSSITWDDLLERVRYLAHKVSNTTGIRVKVEKEGNDPLVLNPSDTINIYRIIQEAVNNAVKHSGGDTIKVSITTSPPAQIEVLDNGVGYDPDSVTSSSEGLRNMKTRAKKLNGRLNIKTSTKGTSVRLELQ